MMLPPQRPLMDDAELCRLRGWAVGTKLVGRDASGVAVIEITAIGQQCILAVDVDGHESEWSLAGRHWKALAPETEKAYDVPR